MLLQLKSFVILSNPEVSRCIHSRWPSKFSGFHGHHVISYTKRMLLDGYIRPGYFKAIHVCTQQLNSANNSRSFPSWSIGFRRTASIIFPAKADIDKVLRKTFSIYLLAHFALQKLPSEGRGRLKFWQGCLNKYKVVFTNLFEFGHMSFLGFPVSNLMWWTFLLRVLIRWVNVEECMYYVGLPLPCLEMLFWSLLPDIDECQIGSHSCVSSPAGNCTNMDGSFRCSCVAGYQGDGYNISQAPGCTRK